MTREELLTHTQRLPFRPFRVVITTGETFDIRHPYLIMVGHRSAVLGLTNEPTGVVYDRIFQVDLFHIVGVEELPAASSDNGAS